MDRIRTRDVKHYNLVNIGDNEYTTEENVDDFLEITRAMVLSFDRYNFFNSLIEMNNFCNG